MVRRYAYFFITLVMMLSINEAFADIWPKPSMKFLMDNHTGHAVSLVRGWQLQSDFESFKVFDTLHREGLQGFEASEESIFSRAYEYKEFQKIILQFEDRKIESPVFRNKSYNSVYRIRIMENQLVVDDITPFMRDSSNWPAFVKAVMLVMIFELLVALVYLLLAKKTMIILFYVILANIITIPVIWFLFPMFLNLTFSVLTGVVFAIIMEAILLLTTCRKWFNPGGAFLLSFMMNVMSLLVGGFAMILLIGFA